MYMFISYVLIQVPIVIKRLKILSEYPDASAPALDEFKSPSAISNKSKFIKMSASKAKRRSETNKQQKPSESEDGGEGSKMECEMKLQNGANDYEGTEFGEF